MRVHVVGGMLSSTPFDLGPPGLPNATLVAASGWPDGLWHLYILQTRGDGSRIQLNVTVTDIIPLAAEAMGSPGGRISGDASAARIEMQAQAAGGSCGGDSEPVLQPPPGGAAPSDAGQPGGGWVAAEAVAVQRGLVAPVSTLIATPFGQPDSFWGTESPPWLGAAVAARPMRGVWETYWEPVRGRMWFWHEASLTATYSHPVELQGALAVLD